MHETATRDLNEVGFADVEIKKQYGLIRTDKDGEKEIFWFDTEDEARHFADIVLGLRTDPRYPNKKANPQGEYPDLKIIDFTTKKDKDNSKTVYAYTTKKQSRR